MTVPFVAGRAPILGCPEPSVFFFVASGCNPRFALVRGLARELSPLDELVIAMGWIGGLLLMLVEWFLGNSRVPRMFPGIVKLGSTSGIGKGGWTAEEVPAG